METAAAFAGISKDTLYRWLREGARNPKGEYGEFHEMVREVMASAEVLLLAQIGKAAREGHWQAAAWHLERKHPERWGRRERHELSGNIGMASVSVANLKSLSNEELEFLDSIGKKLVSESGPSVSGEEDAVDAGDPGVG